jgi:hypothetical protein
MHGRRPWVNVLLVSAIHVTGEGPSEAQSKDARSKFMHTTDVSIVISGHTVRPGSQDFSHSKDLASTFSTSSPDANTNSPIESSLEREAEDSVPKESTTHDAASSVTRAFESPPSKYRHDFMHNRDQASTFATGSPATTSPVESSRDKEVAGLIPKESKKDPASSVANAFQSPPSKYKHDFFHSKDLATTWSHTSVHSAPAHDSREKEAASLIPKESKHDPASSVANAYKSPPAIFHHDYFHTKDLATTWAKHIASAPAAPSLHGGIASKPSPPPSLTLPKDAAHDFDHVITLGLSNPTKIKHAADGSIFGWLVKRSPNGIYYENVNTHQTTWTRPKIFDVMHVSDDEIIAQGDSPPAVSTTLPPRRVISPMQLDKQEAELRLAHELQASLSANSPDAKKLRAALHAVEQRKVKRLKGLSKKEHMLLNTARALEKINGLHGKNRQLQKTIATYVHALQNTQTSPRPATPHHHNAAPGPVMPQHVSAALLKELGKLDDLKKTGNELSHRRALMTLAQKIALGKMPGLSKELRHRVLQLVNEIKWRIKPKSTAGHQ